MAIINPISSPLSSKVLIEASAGTGKTYTITSLVIRYLLGIDGSLPLKLNEILIVTFTKAATAELKVRIYERILESKDALKNNHSDDEFIQSLLTIINPSERYKARSLLNDAELAMSDASIFTIHGFCQRFLSHSPLNTDLPLDFRLETSEDELKISASKQFWREICYFFPPHLAKYAHDIYKDPNTILKNIQPFLSSATDFNAAQSIEELDERLQNCMDEQDESISQKRIQSTLWEFATQQFHKIFTELKTKDGILFFDDIIRHSYTLVTQANAEQLKALRQHYKVAMIDEFQDTDHHQYQIFSTLFNENNDSSLLMIGDPKQSIYKFRGADIGTYLQAKQQTALSDQFSLERNYRSSALVVQGVNELFTQNANPFLAEDIPFIPVSTPSSADQSFLTLNNAIQQGIGIAHLEGNYNKTNFKQSIAAHTAYRIQELLLNGRIHEADTIRDVTPQDITILVRGKDDADPVLAELHKAGIPAVYLSDRNKVFQSKAAALIHLFLTSLLDSRNQELMKQTFASLLYQLSLTELHELLSSNADSQYEKFLIEREQCLIDWERLGIIPMIDLFLHRDKRIHRLRNHPDFDRIMTDIRHITELLHSQSLLEPTKEALLEWFTQQIQRASNGTDNQGSDSNSLRLESEMNVITVMTIHSSKGLEFPITFIPSNIDIRAATPPFIKTIDDDYKTIIYDEDKTEEERITLDEQSENIRLFYVALTRAKYYCECAIAENFLNRSTNVNHLSVYSTLFATDAKEPFTLERLQRLKHVQIISVQEECSATPHITITPEHSLTAANFTGRIYRNWGISSFTKLTRNQSTHASEFMPENQDEEEINLPQQESIAQSAPSIFTFPKGAHVGTFIHNLFEKHSPNQLLNREYFAKLLDQLALSSEITDQKDVWIEVLQAWLAQIFNHSLLPNATFANVLENDSIHELEFLFPIHKHLTASTFNQYLQNYRQQECLPNLEFYNLKGMMKGFIDLIFMHDGKYYIVDYKTNYLGDHRSDYSPNRLHQAMMDAYYDVQYLIYTIALTRYLKSRMKNFSYDEHFGGVFYLFVRGMNEDDNHGVYFTKPTEENILELEQLIGNRHD